MSAHDHRTGLLVPVPPNHFISQIEDMVAKRQPRDISLDRLRALQEWRKSGEYQNACLVGPESNISVEELEWMIKSAMDAWEEIEKQWGLDESGPLPTIVCVMPKEKQESSCKCGGVILGVLVLLMVACFFWYSIARVSRIGPSIVVAEEECKALALI